MTEPRGPEGAHELLVRLRRLEGQVRGLQRMVDDAAPVVDILTQVASARGALAGFGSAVVKAELARVAGSAPAADLARLRDSVGLLAER